MGDGLFFLVGIIFLFILWVASGGPTRPISFSGPFITPITNEGQTQTGYGPTLGGSLSVGGVTTGVGAANGGSSTGIPNTSPYAGHVFLSHLVNGLSGTDPELEYVSLQVSSNSSDTVNITGWKLVSARSGVSVTIPQGVSVLKLGTVSLQPIVLSPGQTASITTGQSPVNVSFETNTCINYLTDQQNYAQCFAAHSSDAGFLSGSWRIYLNQNARLWKNSDEAIELVDTNGKVVDSFSY